MAPRKSSSGSITSKAALKAQTEAPKQNGESAETTAPPGLSGLGCVFYALDAKDATARNGDVPVHILLAGSGNPENRPMRWTPPLVAVSASTAASTSSSGGSSLGDRISEPISKAFLDAALSLANEFKLPHAACAVDPYFRYAYESATSVAVRSPATQYILIRVDPSRASPPLSLELENTLAIAPRHAFYRASAPHSWVAFTGTETEASLVASQVFPADVLRSALAHVHQQRRNGQLPSPASQDLPPAVNFTTAGTMPAGPLITMASMGTVAQAQHPTQVSMVPPAPAHQLTPQQQQVMMAMPHAAWTIAPDGTPVPLIPPPFAPMHAGAPPPATPAMAPPMAQQPHNLNNNGGGGTRQRRHSHAVHSRGAMTNNQHQNGQGRNVSGTPRTRRASSTALLHSHQSSNSANGMQNASGVNGQRVARQRTTSAGAVDRSRVPVTPTSPLYKTRLCERWETSGHCVYGAKCTFAHGISELRGVVVLPANSQSGPVPVLQNPPVAPNRFNQGGIGLTSSPPPGPPTVNGSGALSPPPEYEIARRASLFGSAVPGDNNNGVVVVVPDADALARANPRYKTKLCEKFIMDGFCQYGPRCNFAHGRGELRPKPSVGATTTSSTHLPKFGADCHTTVLAEKECVSLPEDRVQCFYPVVAALAATSGSSGINFHIFERSAERAGFAVSSQAAMDSLIVALFSWPDSAGDSGQTIGTPLSLDAIASALRPLARGDGRGSESRVLTAVGKYLESIAPPEGSPPTPPPNTPPTSSNASTCGSSAARVAARRPSTVIRALYDGEVVSARSVREWSKTARVRAAIDDLLAWLQIIDEGDEPLPNAVHLATGPSPVSAAAAT